MDDYYEELRDTPVGTSGATTSDVLEFSESSVVGGGSGSISFPDTSYSTPSMFLLNSTSISINNGSYYDNYTNFGSDVGDHNGSLGSDMEGKSDGLPPELTEMTESSKHCMIAYCILFVIATSGNLTVLLSVFKQYKKTKSRISLLILHLSIADLIVCGTLIPTEVFWRLTIQWRGGNVLCKVMQFLRAFGLYLSSMVLICVSFDRFFAILFPMKMLKRQGHQRIKIMLWIAWIASAAFSAPQAILFSLASHPEHPSFKQCVTNEFLKNTEDVRMYSIFSVSAMYFAPLVVIIFTYTAILIKIIRKSHQNHHPIQSDEQQQQQQQLNISRGRHSIRFRMSLRNTQGHQRNSSTSNANSCNSMTSSTVVSSNNLHQQDKNQQNHSKLAVTTTSQGRRKPHNSTSDQAEFSSEDGSYSGSPCSTMNMTTANTSTIGSIGGSACPPPHAHHQNSSPEIVTLGRVNSHRTHQLVLRRSENAVGQMSRAKNRTLVMTIVIVAMFVLCWTPYVVMTLWYMIDWEGAKDVDPRVQDGLFVMAVANSCVNPLIYGSFAKNCCGLSKIFSRLRRTRGQM